MLFTQVEAEAIKQGNVEMQGMVYGNTIISHINRKEYDEIIQKAPGYLDFYIRHELWKFYYQINMQLITAYNLKGDYKQAAEAAGTHVRPRQEREDKAGWHGSSMLPESLIMSRIDGKRKKNVSESAPAYYGKFRDTTIS